MKEGSIMANSARWFFAWLVEDPKAEERIPRLVALRDALWCPGDIIKVAFLDDEHMLKDKVKEYAETWTAPLMANLTFVWVEDPVDADIRISFKHSGSWSVIGSTCLRIEGKEEPTMNFGWLDENSTEDEIRRVVLHEFGHALGLIHEHQSPRAGILWDKEQVIRELYYWSRDVVERNLFKPFEEEETQFTEFDPDSIMVYPIPASWTLDGYSVDLNLDLSALDRDFIRTIYP
jgi:hypothetical protein